MNVELGEDADQAEQAVQKLAIRLQRGYFKKKHFDENGMSTKAVCHKSYMVQRRSKRKPPKYEEIVEILHEIKVLKMFQKDIARKHRTSVNAIASLNKRYKKDPNFLDKLKQKEVSKGTKRVGIFNFIQSKIERGEPIISAKQIHDELPSTLKQGHRTPLVIDILKQDFNMSYRKVTKLAPQQNSTQNICLRAAWAKEYLSLLQG